MLFVVEFSNKLEISQSRLFVGYLVLVLSNFSKQHCRELHPYANIIFFVRSILHQAAIFINMTAVKSKSAFTNTACIYFTCLLIMDGRIVSETDIFLLEALLIRKQQWPPDIRH